MANKKSLIKILVLVILFGIIVIGCDNDSGTSNENYADKFIGNWGGIVGGTNVTVNVTSSSWAFLVQGSVYDSGTYVLNGNTAILYSNNNSKQIGTSVFIDTNTISLILNTNSDFPGTYTLYRLL